MLALVSNGFILQLLSFALPSLVRDWETPSAGFSAAFSLHLLGITLGAFTFGRLGDQHGRRTMLLAGCSLQALATLACLFATTPNEMGLLRLIAGIGVGGMTPNAVALASETAPPRWRTTWTTIVLAGIALGSSLPAIAVRVLVPSHGWQSLFWVGGGGALLLLLALAAWLPESAQLLARHADRRGQGFQALFRGRLALVTTCIWVAYAGAMLAMHLLTSWLPLLLENAGQGTARAADLTGIVHLAGTVATLCSTVLLVRLGNAWLIALLLIAFASVSFIALRGFGTPYLAWVIAGIGFGMVGTQGALGAIAGHVYPIQIRASGVGAAIAVGRLGSMLGPLAGGAFQAAGHSSQSLFTLPLWALGAALVAAGVFAWRGGYQPGGN